ncbi:MAG: winged helix-turn-helix domain-containing protein [Candidatus Bathyarchaeota archaeon]|nr:winged helix-turn-helix domain-containing protein [Candidatus Bathyarchaeota archaeon]
MAIPSYERMLLPFLKFICDKKEHSLSETIEHICSIFSLTDEERIAKKATGGLLVNNRVAWARTYLGKAKLLEGTKRGYFKITQRGLDLLKENPSEITDTSLKRFSEFAYFLNPAKDIQKHVITKEKPIEKIPKHNELRDMIYEIGKIEGKIAEVEYTIDNWRLDAVWKTIPTGNPKWAFEVQLAGNFYEALTKLKHAWDKWNSTPFLVTTEKYAAQATILLEGSFHEMRDIARIVTWDKIVSLHKCLQEAHKIKSEIRF